MFSGMNDLWEHLEKLKKRWNLGKMPNLRERNQSFFVALMTIRHTSIDPKRVFSSAGIICTKI
jgi:hypothetical protein